MNRLIQLGILLYAIVSLVDRFFFQLPNIVAIPLYLLAAALILGGFLRVRKG